MNADTRPSHTDDRGATAVEYAILVALIAGVIFLSVAAVGADTLANWGIAW